MPTAAPTAEPAANPAATVERLRATFERGVTRPLAWRQDQLSRLHRALQRHEAELCAALTADLGKSATEGWLTEVGLVASEIARLQKRLPKLAAPRRVPTPITSWPGRSRLVPEPLGVVLIIAPWNYPIQLSLAPLAGALAAGNTVVLKPSEVAPHSAAALARILGEHLDPEGVAVIQGGVSETTALLEQRFEHIFYTGNGTVGRVVMAAAAHHLTPVTLELGGKSPAIVDRSADLTVAARRIAWGKFLNAGQTCVAPDYVLVDRHVADAFVAELSKAITGFYGRDPKRSPDYGRIINDHHLQRLQRLLQDTHAVVGGEVDPERRYVAPTVLRDVAADHPIMQEEIFGPILPIITTADIGEAIAAVLAHPKPLALYLFANDEARIERVLAETSSGGVTVNGTLLHMTSPHLPFGGVGESGMGAYHGDASFERFTHYKPVLQRTTRLDPPVAYPPFGGAKRRLLRRLL